MMNYRQATDNDLEQLLDLIETGFSVQSESHNSRARMQIEEGQEHRVLFSYLYSMEHSNLSRVLLAEDQGRIAAAVGFFPQNLFFETVKIPVWAISPVVTHPDYRGEGAAGNCLMMALENLKQQGISAVFLWGLPRFYPRFGFVPLLPRYKTKLSKEQLQKTESKDGFVKNGGFRNVKLTDIEVIFNLYNQGNHRYWLQPERSLDWWRQRLLEMGIEAAELKEVPFPKEKNFLVWENNSESLSGYLYYESIPDQNRLIISEGMAQNLEQARTMVQSFVRDFLNPDWTLYIRGTPEHLLNAAAYRLGGTHLNPSPLAGMIKILNWPVFLGYLKPLMNDRLMDWSQIGEFPDFIAGDNIIHGGWNPDTGIQLEFDKSGKRKGISINEAALTRLIFGLYDPLDELFRQNRLFQMAFPVKYPFVWDANYLY
jgi:predicted N-acetyltransferase YhbS